MVKIRPHSRWRRARSRHAADDREAVPRAARDGLPRAHGPGLVPQRRRLIKSPKLVLSDAGLLAHLLGGGAAVERSFGAVLENFVLMEIVKQASTSPARPAVFHYRSADGLEVDALIEPRGGPVCAVEVKAAATLSPRDSQGLRNLASTLGDEFGAGVILHAGAESVRLAPKIWAMPLPALWAAGQP